MDLFHNPSSLKPNRFETAIWVSKLVIMSMGIASILVLLKVAIIPCTFDLVLSTLPRLWVSARSWLTLPFLYVIVNFIILTIAASSNFFPHKSSSNNPISFSSSVLDTATYITEPEEEHETKEPKEEEEKEVEEVVIEEVDQEEEEKGVLNDSVFTFNKFITDDPSPENCTNDYFLPDSGDNDDDTLEATWRAIMEGQGKTMKPQLKKSDTWTARIVKAEPFRNNGKRGGGGGEDPVAWAQKELTKSDTFNDRASLRREKSMSPEELALRSEAFIKNFNNQMKLQRLESYQRFKEMVSRGRV